MSEQEEATKAAKCVEHVAEWMETASEQEVASLVQETVTKVKRGEQLGHFQPCMTEIYLYI